MSDPSVALTRLLARQNLSRAEVHELFGQIMDGEVAEPQIAALLIALAMKGETPEEIAGAATAMRAWVRRVPHAVDGVVDTCGTGGDGRGTFNVSTAAAFVVAAAGVPVAKHGNRAISSRSGSADVLSALGVRIEIEPEESGRQLEQIGLAFLFAPSHHPAMKVVAPVRKALGVRTVFNLLGPLTNPAGARRQVLGVFARERVEPVARVLAGLGAEHALVVHGADGTDEITTVDTTFVAEVRGDEVSTYELDARDLGAPRALPEDLAGGSPEENAEKLEAVLDGEGGALAEIVAVNAGAALYVGGAVPDLVSGYERARALLATGEAREVLERLRSFR